MTVGLDPQKRGGYLNLAALDEENPGVYRDEEDLLLAKAAAAEEPLAQAEARLELAQFYVANQFAEEAIGVLNVLEPSDRGRRAHAAGAPDPRDRRHARAAARPRPSPSSPSPAFLEDPDAVMWRAIARSAAGDFRGARLDAMASEIVLDSYPRLGAPDVPLRRRPRRDRRRTTFTWHAAISG